VLDAFLEAGARRTAREIAAATAWRLDFIGRWGMLWDACDALLLPVMDFALPEAGFAGSLAVADDPRLGRLLRFCAPANLTGDPALSLPGMAAGDGAPVGFQISGPAGSEALLLRLGHALQQGTDWHDPRPGLAFAPSQPLRH
jgi:amidase